MNWGNIYYFHNIFFFLRLLSKCVLFAKYKEGKIMGRTVCFIGHRKIDGTDELKAELYAVIENLITNENVNTFLFGSRSQFDDLCHSIVTELKEKYPDIQRVCFETKSEYAVLEDEREEMEKSFSKFFKEEVHFNGYEKSVKPEKMYSSGRASYIERNQIMIDESDFCIVYYDENYLPPRRKYSKRDLTDYQPKSGTHIAYDYAKRKKKTIINLYPISV